MYIVLLFLSFFKAGDSHRHHHAHVCVRVCVCVLWCVCTHTRACACRGKTRGIPAEMAKIEMQQGPY